MPQSPTPIRHGRTLPAPMVRLLGLAAVLALLGGCGSDGTPAPPPLSTEALAAVRENPGVRREKLARAVDALFASEGIGETRAVLVMHGGRLVAERYAEGYDAKTRFIGWSMSKTVTAVLVGLLVSEGRLHLDSSPPIPRWQRSGDPRGEITLRQLLQMRSGLRHQENAEPRYASAEVRMMFLDGRDDMAGWAEAQPLENEPGRRFQYSTPGATILSDVVARVLAPEGSPAERREAADAFFRDRLTGPIGLSSMTAEYDREGTMIGGAMVWANARDWARFGDFLRNKGSVRGAQVVPRNWVEFMARPSPRAPDYGAMVWLNRDSGSERDNLFADKGPASLFALVGHLGQYVLVSPAQKLVVVRLGDTEKEELPALRAKLADLVALYPED